MVSAEFHPTKETYTFAEVAEIVKESLRSQINRENLEKLFSYNVSNEKLLIARVVPLFLKNLAMKYVYTTSALANTATITNIGNISVTEEHRPYVEMLHALLAMSKGQHLKERSALTGIHLYSVSVMILSMRLCSVDFSGK